MASIFVYSTLKMPSYIALQNSFKSLHSLTLINEIEKWIPLNFLVSIEHSKSLISGNNEWHDKNLATDKKHLL